MKGDFVYRRKGTRLPLPDELSVIMAVHLVLLALSFAPLCAETTEQAANATSMFACTDEDEGKLRVRGTVLTSTGHLEICHDRTWGVICANNWGKREADVSCRQLGFTKAIAKPLDPSVLKKWLNLSHPNYTRGSGPRKAWLDHIYCSGKENDILQCRYGRPRGDPANKAYQYVNNRTCFENEEIVGVMCNGSEVKQETSSSPSSPSRTQMGASSPTTTGRLHSTFSSEVKQETSSPSASSRTQMDTLSLSASSYTQMAALSPTKTERAHLTFTINERQRPKYCPAVFGCAHYNPPSENDCCQTCNQTISVCPGIECPPVDRCARYEEEARPGECCLRCIRQKGNTKGLSKGRFCSNVVCPVGQICTVKNDHPMCTCRTKACRRQPGQSEVCGTDGRTYLSSCDLRQSLCRSCRAGTVAIKYERACSAPSE